MAARKPQTAPTPQGPPPADDPSAVKDPSEWVTGGEPMTGAQESYLKTLGREAGETVAEDMTKAEASEKIEELREKTGRGRAKTSAAKKPAAGRAKKK
ncbi:MAG: DUF3072 domain-containing protein [Isosphaera sp.]|nr:DUF3072 domain-containing protein [Isosphaera sp.]